VSLYKRLHDIQAAPDAGPTKKDTDRAELRRKIHDELIDELGPVLLDKNKTPDELRRRINDQLHQSLARQKVPLSITEKNRLIEEITSDILGYGPIDELLKMDDVTDIMVNGPGSVYVERQGSLERSTVTFADDFHLRQVIDKIVSEVGRRIDEAQPICDARLADGSRVNAVISPIVTDGPYLTIRKFSKERLVVDDLIRLETCTAQVARFLQCCIVGRLNIVVAGGSGTGKTTLLNVLSSFIPSDERIITVEDAKELSLSQDHVLPMESRPPSVSGKGEVSIRDLVKNTLRMRPDRIIVGECRGGEALDMLQAMNTGHDGSLTCVHANSARDTLARLETLVLMAGFDLPVRAIRDQIASAVDLVVHMARMRDGSRRIVAITEVEGMEGDIISLQDIFKFDYSMGTDDYGKHRGRLKATGTQPKFLKKLQDHGIRVPPNLFDPEEFGGPASLPTAGGATGPGAPSPEAPTDPGALGAGSEDRHRRAAEDALARILEENESASEGPIAMGSGES